jgi:CelD/BcsL family acetyltransferase involved in cellulose biosynthesis
VLRRNGSLLSVSNAHTPAVAHVAANKAAGRELFRGIVEENFRKVDLRRVPARGCTREALLDASKSLGHGFLSHSSRAQPFVDVTGTWTEYETRQLTAKRRSSLRRLERRLAELGSVRFDVHHGEQSLEPLLEEGFQTEARGWKGRAGTAVLSRPSTRRFYFDLAAWAAQAGILRLACLRIDDRLAAFSFSVEQHAVHYGLKTCYDESLARFAPGIVLTYKIIRYASEEPGLSRLEMPGGGSDYKAEFATGYSEQEHIEVFRRGWLGNASRAISNAQHGTRETLKRYVPQPVRRRLYDATGRTRA